MEIHQLRYFVEVAHTASVSRAAERCKVAQPSLSQQLKKLEDSVGAKLFDRLTGNGGRGMLLTEAGKSLLPRAKRILAEVEAATRGDVGEGGGDMSLSVGAIPTMAPYLLPPALRRVERQWPHCQLNLREDLTENLLDAVASGELDCAIMSSHDPHDDIETDLLADEELVVIVPDDWPGKGGTGEISLGELKDKAAVSLEDVHCLGRQIEGFCATRRIKPKVICRTTQLQTVFEMVRLGVGVSIVPEMAVVGAVGGEEGKGGYQVLRLRQGRPKREIVAVWRRGRTRTRAALAFVQWVREALHKPPEATLKHRQALLKPAGTR